MSLTHQIHPYRVPRVLEPRIILDGPSNPFNPSSRGTVHTVPYTPIGILNAGMPRMVSPDLSLISTCYICQHQFRDTRPILIRAECRHHQVCGQCSRTVNNAAFCVHPMDQVRRCKDCFNIRRQYHACGHYVHGMVLPEGGDRKHLSPCKLGCRGAARTGPLQIAYWLEFGHECPIQIKRWLMGETDIPGELFDLLYRAGCNPPTGDLSDNNAKKEFHGWFINDIMARVPTPSWPVWLVDIGGIRRHALIRHAWDEYGRGFKTLTWPDISFGVTHPIWEMTEWRQTDTEPGRDFLWARDRLALMEAYGLEIDQGHGQLSD